MSRIGRVAVAVLWAFAGCGGDGGRDDSADVGGLDVVDVADVPDVVVPVSCAAYEGRGPWPVGVTTLSLPDRQVEVWYPAVPGTEAGVEMATYDVREWLPEGERDKVPDTAPSRYTMQAWRSLPVAEGRFPLVLFSHGFAAFRTQSSEITTHLASWGFVVAAPDYPERGLTAVLEMTIEFESPDRETQEAVIDLMAVQDADSTSPLFGRVDTDWVIASGHSAGGFASLKALDLDRVVGAIVLAAGFFEAPEAPVEKGVLLVAGTEDDIAPYRSSQGAYDKVSPPRAFAGIEGAGHLAFSDLCEIAKEVGGIVPLAIDSGLDVPEFMTILASDGCTPEELPAAEAWPLVNHLAVAFARFVLGIDPQPVDLDATTIEKCFGNRLSEYQFEATSDPAASGS